MEFGVYGVCTTGSALSVGSTEYIQLNADLSLAQMQIDLI